MAPKLSPPETLFEAVRQLVIGMVEPVDEISLVERLGIEKGQAKVWLKRLIQEGVVKKVAKKKVQRPKPATDQQPLFEDQS
jgi:ribosomal protein S25